MSTELDNIELRKKETSSVPELSKKEKDKVIINDIVETTKLMEIEEPTKEQLLHLEDVCFRLLEAVRNRTAQKVVMKAKLPSNLFGNEPNNENQAQPNNSTEEDTMHDKAKPDSKGSSRSGSNQNIFSGGGCDPQLIDENLVYAISSLLKYLYLLLDNLDVQHRDLATLVSPSTLNLQAISVEEKTKKMIEWLKIIETLCRQKFATGKMLFLPERNKEQKEADFIMLILENYILNSGGMDNQRVILTEQQKQNLEYAVLAAKVEKLQLYRMDTQRCSYVDKYRQLSDLVSDVFRSNKTAGFDNQRVVLTEKKKSEMDLNKITKLLEKSETRRLDNQEWISPVQQRGIQLVKVSEKLTEMDNPTIDNQRFVLSEEKQRAMYVTQVFARLDKMAGFENQKSENPRNIKEKQLDQIDNSIVRMQSPSMISQRFAPRKASATSIK